MKDVGINILGRGLCSHIKDVNISLEEQQKKKYFVKEAYECLHLIIQPEDNNVIVVFNSDECPGSIGGV